MQTKILLSIKPKFAEKIFSGAKRYEFRRVIFKSNSVTRVVVYASSPVQRVIGEFSIAEIITSDVRRLWQKTKDYAGIEKEHFDEYFEGLGTAYAIKICNPTKYRKPAKLENLFKFDRPPQSFRYLE
jgi:predicted transcriptional regulator